MATKRKAPSSDDDEDAPKCARLGEGSATVVPPLRELEDLWPGEPIHADDEDTAGAKNWLMAMKRRLGAELYDKCYATFLHTANEREYLMLSLRSEASLHDAVVNNDGEVWYETALTTSTTTETEVECDEEHGSDTHTFEVEDIEVNDIEVNFSEYTEALTAKMTSHRLVSQIAIMLRVFMRTPSIVESGTFYEMPLEIETLIGDYTGLGHSLRCLREVPVIEDERDLDQMVREAADWRRGHHPTDMCSRRCGLFPGTVKNPAVTNCDSHAWKWCTLWDPTSNGVVPDPFANKDEWTETVVVSELTGLVTTSWTRVGEEEGLAPLPP